MRQKRDLAAAGQQIEELRTQIMRINTESIPKIQDAIVVINEENYSETIEIRDLKTENETIRGKISDLDSGYLSMGKNVDEEFQTTDSQIKSIREEVYSLFSTISTLGEKPQWGTADPPQTQDVAAQLSRIQDLENRAENTATGAMVDVGKVGDDLNEWKGLFNCQRDTFRMHDIEIGNAVKYLKLDRVEESSLGFRHGNENISGPSDSTQFSQHSIGSDLSASAGREGPTLSGNVSHEESKGT